MGRARLIYLLLEKKDMKKLLALGLAFLISFCSCLNTESETSINANGSGKFVAAIDLSEMMKMMAGKNAKAEEFVIDTVIHMKFYSDTASFLTAEQKRLVKDMQLKILMDVRDLDALKFRVSILTSFASLDDFNALNDFMKQASYDQLFDKAMKLPVFDDAKESDEEGKKSNDNIFATAFPAFYRCTYSKGAIQCRLDAAKKAEVMKELSAMGFDPQGEMESKMFAAASFTNKLVLPAKPTKIEGSSWKQGASANELVQTGNLFDLYSNPEKYEYNILY